MGNLTVLTVYVVISLMTSISSGKGIKVNVICDDLLYETCVKDVAKYQIRKSDLYTFELKKGSDNLVSNYEHFNVTDDAWNIFLVFGNSVTTNAASAVATYHQLPIFLYDTSHWKNTIFSSDVIPLHGDKWSLGQATAAIVEPHYLPKTCFIIDYHYLNDKFLDGFRSKIVNYQLNDTQIIIYRDDEDIATLSLKLTLIKEHGYRLIITHVPSIRIKKVFELCQQQGHFKPGFAWILSEMSMPATEAEEFFYTPGLLGIQSKEIDGLESLIEKSLASLYVAIEDISKIDPLIKTDVMFRDSVVRYVTSKNYSSKGLLLFDQSRRRINVTYVVRNKAFDKETNTSEWNDIGFVGNNIFTLNTIYWPGYTIFGPVENVNPLYRVVTRADEPFVFINGPVEGPNLCMSSFPCCLVTQTEPMSKSAFIDTCLLNTSREVYCCSGIAIELLESLSHDLKFNFIIYFENNTDYGNPVNDTMTGMVGDIINGVADIIVGAFSVTSLRSKFISYTDPFYFSGYSLVMKKAVSSPAIDAFLKPFDDTVWFLIIVSAIATGVSTSLLEWNSPFGLNPWARKRAKNYTLGSGLTMVFSLWFGHSVSTKPPKGWPSKVLQNVWAALAIFIVASYTANLAAYLAGNIIETQIFGIKDSQLNTKKIALIESSAVANFVEKIDSNVRNPIHVSGLDDAFQGLVQGRYDIYVDDTPLLEYKLAEVDSKCSIRFSGKEFGENFYAFGLPNDAIWLKDKLSAQILDYVETGYLVTITRKFVSKRNCNDKTFNVESYNLETTGGLFLVLVCGLVLSFILLFLEHVSFKYLVPYLRKQAADSRWKSRRMLEFFNQRLYRTVMSETLVSPQQTAREMMKIMKYRQFTRMFQKNELKEQQKAVQRAHPKGLKFMNLTDILLRSHSDDRADCNGDGVIFSTSSSVKLYNISEEDEINNGNVKFSIEDNSDDVFYTESLDENKSEEVHDTSFGRNNNVSCIRTNNSDSNLEKMQVNHLWDQKQIDCITMTDELDQKKKKRLQLSYSDTSFLTRYAQDIDRAHLDRQRLVRQEETQLSSDTEEMAATSQQKTTVPKSKSYFSSSVKLKDNRVKSTIRRHALAQFKRHSTSVFDECAVEALSKEDLLVLWKRSEIELQTKLNKLQSQNNHLKCLLQIVESDDQETPKSYAKKKPKLLCTKL